MRLAVDVDGLQLGNFRDAQAGGISGQADCESHFFVRDTTRNSLTTLHCEPSPALRPSKLISRR